MFVYYSFSDIIFRFGMHMTRLRFSSFPSSDTATLFLWHCQLLRINGPVIRERMESLSAFHRQICPSPDYAGNFVASTCNVVDSLATLERLQRVLVVTKISTRKGNLGRTILREKKKREISNSYCIE